MAKSSSTGFGTLISDAINRLSILDSRTTQKGHGMTTRFNIASKFITPPPTISDDTFRAAEEGNVWVCVDLGKMQGCVVGSGERSSEQSSKCLLSDGTPSSLTIREPLLGERDNQRTGHINTRDMD